MDQNKRPSVYLVERCENFARVLSFFLAPHHGQSPGASELLVVFLAQLGFWEWELDNLIHAFTTFPERARAWEHENGFGLASTLKEQGILVRHTAVRNIKLKRPARRGRRPLVYAPVGPLNDAIRQWNVVLDACEESVLVPTEEREEAVRLGASVLPDLSRFRKTPLPEPSKAD